MLRLGDAAGAWGAARAGDRVTRTTHNQELRVPGA